MLQTKSQYNDITQKILQKILNPVPNLSRKGCNTTGWHTKLAQNRDRMVVQGSQQCRNPSLHFPSASALFLWSWWVTLSGVCVTGLKSAFPGFALKVAFALRGCQHDRVLINYPSRLTGKDIIFHTCVCVWVRADLVSLLPLQKTCCRDGHMLWTHLLPTDLLTVSPYERMRRRIQIWTLQLWIARVSPPSQNYWNTQKYLPKP